MVRIIATNGPPERWLDIRRKIFFIKGLLWGVIWLYKGKSHSIVSFSFEGGSTIKGGGCYITFLREKRWQGVICTIQHRNIFELCNRQNLSFCLFRCPIREMVIKILLTCKSFVERVVIFTMPYVTTRRKQYLFLCTNFFNFNVSQTSGFFKKIIKNFFLKSLSYIVLIGLINMSKWRLLLFRFIECLFAPEKLLLSS